MGEKQYLNAFINNSATIREALAADVVNAAHKAVAFDGEGKLALPSADGEAAIGVILSDAVAGDDGTSKAGTEVDVLIKDVGLAEAAAAIAKGDRLTATTTGALRKAASGEFILGVALSAAAAAGELVQIQLTKSGYEK